MHNWLHDVSQYIFLNDSPQPADMIFIPGSRHAEPAEHAASLWQQKYAPLLLPSGRWSSGLDSFPGQISGRRNYTGVFSSECDFMCHILRAAGIPSSAILREDRATFTYQNAICSRYITESAGISVRRAILCCMPVHARRSFMYYSALFPEAEILAYVRSGEPMDKAGAYALQGRASLWITRLEGSYSSVIGLPLYLVRRLLLESGYRFDP